MEHQSLPPRLLGEAVVATMVQLQLLTKHAHLSKNPNMSCFWVLGRNVFVLVSKRVRGTMDSISIKMVFVGYHNGSTVYRLFDPQTNAIQFSYDVVSDETTPVEEVVTPPFGGLFDDSWKMYTWTMGKMIKQMIDTLQVSH